MFSLRKAILLFPVLAMVATSCDNISEDDRYIPVAEVTPQRAVLLEEFTGQYCQNCPTAHEVISQLKAQYGDAFIPVSIHAGSSDNAKLASDSDTKTNQGLKQEEGDYYANMWGISSFPRGVLNRTSDVLANEKWAAQIAIEVQKSASLDINLSAVYNAETKTVEVSTQILPVKTLSGALQLWLVESNIVSMQRNGSKTDRKYVHNHVFRSSINGSDGEPVMLVSNVYTEQTNSIVIKDLWEPENLSVVAFVYNGDGVLNAAEVAVQVEKTEE